VCLQETKLAEIDLQLVRSLWGNSFFDWEMLPATGTVGGVLLLWDRRVLEKLDSVVCQFFVSCLWKTLADGMEWVGTGLYGPTADGYVMGFGMSLGVCARNGGCLGVSLATLMWFAFRVREGDVPG
jgi:hypothetical protein